MQILRIIVACAAMTLPLAACGDDSDSKTPVDPIVDSGTDAGNEDAAEPERCPAGDASVVIRETTLEGSLLTLHLEFGGGCEAHSFSIGWSGVEAQSNPPRIPLELNHYGNGDSCAALLRESIVIDLSSVDGNITPTWVDLVDPKGKPIEGAMAVLYEGPKQGETIPEDALKVRRDCSHATF